jgi:hypothetical protein
MKQVRGTLLVAGATGRPWPRQGRFSLYTKPGDAAGGITGEGALWFELEPFEHNRPHLLVRQYVPEGKTWRRIEVPAVARTAGLSLASTFEMAIPLTALGVTGKPPPPLRWFAVLTQPGRSPPYLTLPRGLDLLSTDGTLPARSRRPTDGRCSGASGSRRPRPSRNGMGALSPDGFTRQGETAHRMALAIDGAYGPGGEAPKRDEPLERDSWGAPLHRRARAPDA